VLDIPRPTKKIREPSLIPMINIVLLLLVFFLVTGSIEKFDPLPVDLPLARSSKRLPDGQVMIILGSQKEILVNDELVRPSEFVDTVKNYVKINGGKPVISLKADQHLPATFLISIMNQVREAGGSNISLITTPF